MLHIYPDFYDRFACTCGACPDNCCQGWEIVVDDDTAAFYDSLNTPLGERLRAAMTTDEDGDRILNMVEGKCPLWTEDHLCSVELELGHDAPCATCRKFPRLTQDYGAFTEYGLTLACPEAARLILTHKGPWMLRTEGEMGQPDEELDWEFLTELSSARQVLLEQCWRQDLTDRQALSMVLAFGARFQKVFDGEAPGEFDEMEYLTKIATAAPGDMKPLLTLHRDLEILTEDWKNLLDEALEFEPTASDWEALDSLPEGDALRNLMSYYLYRYWFQAVADYDCLLKCKLLAVNWAVVRYLLCMKLAKTGQTDYLRIFQLYAKEVEHDACNREAVEDALLEEPQYHWENLLRLI